MYKYMPSHCAFPMAHSRHSLDACQNELNQFPSMSFICLLVLETRSNVAWCPSLLLLLYNTPNEQFMRERTCFSAPFKVQSILVGNKGSGSLKFASKDSNAATRFSFSICRVQDLSQGMVLQWVGFPVSIRII